jgi:hypothetical protein
MISVERLQAALAAVPVNQSCTGGAVGTLFTAGRAAAQQIANGSTTAQEQMQVRKACCQQQLPGACMPVLAWLAAGLRSGLSATATQQAHEMACVLLWVVSRSMPDDVESSQGNVGQHETALILQQLGTPGGCSCAFASTRCVSMYAAPPVYFLGCSGNHMQAHMYNWFTWLHSCCSCKVSSLLRCWMLTPVCFGVVQQLETNELTMYNPILQRRCSSSWPRWLQLWWTLPCPPPLPAAAAAAAAVG